MILHLKKIGRIIFNILHLFVFLANGGRIKAIENSVEPRKKDRHALDRQIEKRPSERESGTYTAQEQRDVEKV